MTNTEKQEAIQQMISCLEEFKKVSINLYCAWDHLQMEGVEDEEWCYEEKLPFQDSFEVVADETKAWVDASIEKLKQL